jgi:hypothetical protein
VLDDLKSEYKNVCAYSGLYILGGEQTVDHYVPRAKTWKTDPMMAYKWSNFRLASWSMNYEKGESMEVVDPFKIDYGWFTIDFDNMFIKSGPQLKPADKADVDATILRLKLNKGSNFLYWGITAPAKPVSPKYWPIRWQRSIKRNPAA